MSSLLLMPAPKSRDLTAEELASELEQMRDWLEVARSTVKVLEDSHRRVEALLHHVRPTPVAPVSRNTRTKP